MPSSDAAFGSPGTGNTVPLVSIAIRAFRRRWLHEAIASVLTQTYQHLELVIFDDAGDLEDVAASFADARVRYVRAVTRLGASGRFSAAVAECRGEFIGLLDDDDRYERTFVERLLRELLDDPDAGIAFCRTTYDYRGRLFTPRDSRPSGRIPNAAYRMLAERWTVSPSHMLIRRNALDAAWRDQAMPDGVSPDLFVNMRVALAGWHHVLSPWALCVYRWHDEQLSRRGPSATDLPIATLKALRVDDGPLGALRNRALARAYLARGVARVAAGDRRASLEDCRAAAHASPRSWRLPRHLLTLAAWSGVAGSRLTRGVLTLMPRGHHRTRPPRSIGTAGR